MTLAVLTTRVEYTANGSAHTFAFTFPCLDSTHIEVRLDGVKQTAGYEVLLNANQTASPGGSVRFVTVLGANDPPDAGTVVRLDRTVPLTQETVYAPYSAFPAKATERALDRAIMQVQQLGRDIGDLIVTADSDAAEYRAFEAGAKIVIRTDLLG